MAQPTGKGGCGVLRPVSIVASSWSPAVRASHLMPDRRPPSFCRTGSTGYSSAPSAARRSRSGVPTPVSTIRRQVGQWRAGLGPRSCAASATPSSKWQRSQCHVNCSTRSCGRSTGRDGDRLRCRPERDGSAITTGGVRPNDKGAGRMDGSGEVLGIGRGESSRGSHG